MRLTLPVGLLVCGFVLSQSMASASAIGLQELTTKNIINGNQDNTVVELLTLNSDKALTVIAETTLIQEKEEQLEENVPKEKKHVVQKAESLSTIASNYDVEWQRIYDKNLEIVNPDVIEVGKEITIPENDEVIESREIPTPVPAPVKTSNNTTTAKTTINVAPVAVSRGNTSGNTYGAGYCTWYVKNRRPDLPNNLGNARTWVARAAGQGIPTGSTPRVGAAAQRNNHIAYVEAVNGDGTITITDMNYQSLYTITTRTVPASQWTYIY